MAKRSDSLSQLKKKKEYTSKTSAKKTSKSPSTSAAKTKTKSTNKAAKKKQGNKAKNGERKKRQSLTPLRKELVKYVDEANERAAKLRHIGRMSGALLEAEESLNKKGREEYEQSGYLFSINKSSYRELRREAARVQKFLADETSQLTAKNEADAFADKYGSLFGKEFYDQYGVNYDFSVITEGKAQRLFSLYRRLEERYSNLLQGKMGFGSENLISALYEYMIDVPDWVPDETGDEAIFNRAVQMLSDFDQRRKEEAQNMASSVDYGVLDKWKKARSVAEFTQEGWW